MGEPFKVVAFLAGHLRTQASLIGNIGYAPRLSLDRQGRGPLVEQDLIRAERPTEAGPGASELGPERLAYSNLRCGTTRKRPLPEISVAQV